MGNKHTYSLTLEWTGNTGEGTKHYRAYKRDYDIITSSKPVLKGSSDPAFRGDPTRYNPEELFVASLSSCHMLWYLHLCADAGIIVIAYRDESAGFLQEDEAQGGYFTKVILRPRVSISDATRKDEAMNLHNTAHRKCFIANSVNVPVLVEATIE